MAGVRYYPSGKPLTDNALDVAQTSVGNTTAIPIEIPEGATKVILKHITASQTVWLGKDSSITAGGAGTWPLETSEQLIIDVSRGNNNSIYGIASAGTITVYAVATVRE